MMDLSFHEETEKLKEKLYRRQMERIELEKQMNEYCKSSRRFTKLKVSTVQKYWEHFMEQEKRSHARNVRIIQQLTRIETQAAILASRTEQLRLMKKQYEMQLDKHHPDLLEQASVNSSKYDESASHPYNQHIVHSTPKKFDRATTDNQETLTTQSSRIRARKLQLEKFNAITAEPNLSTIEYVAQDDARVLNSIEKLDIRGLTPSVNLDCTPGRFANVGTNDTIADAGMQNNPVDAGETKILVGAPKPPPRLKKSHSLNRNDEKIILASERKCHNGNIVPLSESDIASSNCKNIIERPSERFDAGVQIQSSSSDQENRPAIVKIPPLHQSPHLTESDSLRSKHIIQVASPESNGLTSQIPESSSIVDAIKATVSTFCSPAANSNDSVFESVKHRSDVKCIGDDTNHPDSHSDTKDLIESKNFDDAQQSSANINTPVVDTSIIDPVSVLSSSDDLPSESETPSLDEDKHSIDRIQTDNQIKSEDFQNTLSSSSSSSLVSSSNKKANLNSSDYEGDSFFDKSIPATDTSTYKGLQSKSNVNQQSSEFNDIDDELEDELAAALSGHDPPTNRRTLTSSHSSDERMNRSTLSSAKKGKDDQTNDNIKDVNGAIMKRVTKPAKKKNPKWSMGMDSDSEVDMSFGEDAAIPGLSDGRDDFGF